MVVDLFIPCFIDQIYPETGMNVVKLLEKCGCEIRYNPEQTCCGQPAFNSGYWDEAKEVGEKFIREFADKECIVTPSTSCAGMVKNYYSELFYNTALHNECNHIRKNIYELTDFLVNELKVKDMGARLDGVATYHDSCAALREYGLKNEPRILLENVKGLELREMNDRETCCGFGGTFAAKFEPIAVGMVEQKVENALATEADFIISTDSSCLMHIDSYLNAQSGSKEPEKLIKIMHIADVLTSGW